MKYMKRDLGCQENIGRKMLGANCVYYSWKENILGKDRDLFLSEGCPQLLIQRRKRK
jgi:hypothetical protein